METSESIFVLLWNAQTKVLKNSRVFNCDRGVKC